MRRSTLQRLSPGRNPLLSLALIALLSTVVRAIMSGWVHAPTVVLDELGYTKLAQSIGFDGRLALFNEAGPSYSPLYPALIAPVYALGASGASAYTLIKIVNALVMSLSVFAVYGIARFVLPPTRSLLAAGVSVVAPLMLYTSFTMSENLAYPLCLVAIWAMLVAVRTPGPTTDALVLASIVVAFVARIQLIVLLPAALTAIVLAEQAAHEPGAGRRVLHAVRSHWLLFGATAAGLLAVGIRALAGGDVYSVLGRYANVGRAGLPNIGRVLELTYHHLAGLELAVGFIPFVGTLVAAFVFIRSGRPQRYVPFAAVAVSLVAWLLIQVAIDAALFEGPGMEQPRLHERFLVYAIPFFLVALLAAVDVRPAQASARVHYAAAAVASVLPAFIPFGTYVNPTIGGDTFGLHPFARASAGELAPLPFAAGFAVLVAATLSLTYARILRQRVALTVVYLTMIFALMSVLAGVRIKAASVVARSVLPEHVDWIDRAAPAGDVVLVGDADALAARESAFFSLTIDRVFTLCGRTIAPEFGERQVEIGSDGVIRTGSRPVRAAYAVVPARLSVEGRVVARNRQGKQTLVAPAGERLIVAPSMRRRGCR